jgi:hypothetical protein
MANGPMTPPVAAPSQPAPSLPVSSPSVSSPPVPAVEVRAPELTAAGLVRRSPKQQIRDLTADALVPGAPRPGAQRSPEEVRRMLSRYRTGLQRGRTGPAGEPGEPSVPGGGAEQVPNAEDGR